MRNGKSAKKAKPEQTGNVRTTIVIPEPVHLIGVQSAKDRRRSFSNYVTTLIEADALPKQEAVS